MRFCKNKSKKYIEKNDIVLCNFRWMDCVQQEALWQLHVLWRPVATAHPWKLKTWDFHNKFTFRTQPEANWALTSNAFQRFLLKPSRQFFLNTWDLRSKFTILPQPEANWAPTSNAFYKFVLKPSRQFCIFNVNFAYILGLSLSSLKGSLCCYWNYIYVYSTVKEK